MSTLCPSILGHWWRSTGYFGYEHTRQLLLRFKGLHVVLSRSRQYIKFTVFFFITILIRPNRRFLPWNNARHSLANDILRILDIVVSWSHLILFNSSESDLIWMLFNELPIYIFFIPEYTEMTWDRWWILNFHMIAELAPIVVAIRSVQAHCVTSSLWLYLVIRTWTWKHCLLTKLFVFEPLFLWLKVTRILYNANSVVIKTRVF